MFIFSVQTSSFSERVSVSFLNVILEPGRFIEDFVTYLETQN